MARGPLVFFPAGFSLQLYSPFGLRHLTTDGGYLVYTTDTVLYRPTWNFAGSFCHGSVDMYVFGHYRQFYFCLFFFTFELNHFWGLIPIKEHYSGYLVCATSRTVLYRSV